MTERHVQGKISGVVFKVLAEYDGHLWLATRFPDGSYDDPCTHDADGFEPYDIDAVFLDGGDSTVRKAVFSDVDFTGGDPVRLRHGLGTDAVIVQVLDADSGAQRYVKVIDIDTVAVTYGGATAKVVVIG